VPTDLKPITDLKEKDQVRRWMGRIELAQRFMGRWDENVKALAGDFNSPQELGEEAIDVNMTRSVIKTALAPMWLVEPHITVNPTQERVTTDSGDEIDNIAASRMAEVEVNYWFRELEVRKQVRKVLLDGEATNQGYLYLGWATSGDEKADNSPTVRKGRPFIRRHPPKHVAVPPGHYDLEDAPWVCLKFLKTPMQVKEKYGDIAKQIKPTIGFDVGDDEEHSTILDEFLESEDALLVEIYQVWDKTTKKVTTLAKGFDKFVEAPKAWPVMVEGFPLAHYRPEEVPDEYWATPPMTYGMPQQKERNSIRTNMRKRRNRTKSVIFMDGEMADEVGNEYIEAQDGKIIKVGDGTAQDVRQKMVIDTGIPFDQGDIVYDAVTASDFRESYGQSAEQRGSGDPNIESATASANIEKNAQIRASEKGDRVQDLYLTTARKLVMILRQHPNIERTRRIVGPNAEFLNVKYTLRELQGEFDYVMDFGAAVADTPQSRQVTAMTNYNLLRPDPLINPEKLIMDVLDSQNTPNPQAYVLNLRTPEEELQMMIQGLPVEAHERDDHQTHIQQHEQQRNALERQVTRAGPRTPQGERLRMAIILLTANVQDHVRHAQRLASQTGGGRRPGSPVAENLLRKQSQVRQGGETQAELAGQPLTPSDTVQ
jgi:hypothetical protein